MTQDISKEFHGVVDPETQSAREFLLALKHGLSGQGPAIEMLSVVKSLFDAGQDGLQLDERLRAADRLIESLDFLDAKGDIDERAKDHICQVFRETTSIQDLAQYLERQDVQAGIWPMLYSDNNTDFGLQFSDKQAESLVGIFRASDLPLDDTIAAIAPTSESDAKSGKPSYATASAGFGVLPEDVPKEQENPTVPLLPSNVR